jgi:hypothetical protein
MKIDRLVRFLAGIISGMRYDGGGRVRTTGIETSANKRAIVEQARHNAEAVAIVSACRMNR